MIGPVSATSAACRRTFATIEASSVRTLGSSASIARADGADDLADRAVFRGREGLAPLDDLDRRLHRAAVAVAKHDDHVHAEHSDAVLEAAERARVDRVAGDVRREQVFAFDVKHERRSRTWESAHARIDANGCCSTARRSPTGE